MSDNKKYYYLKLKDTYFDQDSIKIIESLPNGHLYSLIILKLYLKSCKYDGHLKMNHYIPYSNSREDIEILSNVIGHDIDHVEKAIAAAIKFNLITIMKITKYNIVKTVGINYSFLKVYNLPSHEYKQNNIFFKIKL